MTRRALGLIRLTVLAWLAGWACVTASATGGIWALWPGLPLWVIPLGSVGLLLLAVGGFRDLRTLVAKGLATLVTEGLKKLAKEGRS